MRQVVARTGVSPGLPTPGSVPVLLCAVTLWNPQAVRSNAFWLGLRYASVWDSAPSCPEVISVHQAIKGKCRGMFVNT